MTAAAPRHHHQLLDYRPPPDTGLAVVHVDAHLVVLDKPSGLLSVPGRGERMQDCLAARAVQVFPDALVVHRLDMDTSGLLMMARSKEMQRRLAALLESRQVDKRYEAVVAGLVEHDEGTVDQPLITDWPNRPLQKIDVERGKPAMTHYRVLARDFDQQTSRVSLTPVTGRSHQLRVHMLALGHPMLGDALYGDAASRARSPRLLLHAAELRLAHPATGCQVSWCCPVPF